MKEINITEIGGFKIGNAENIDAATGCTVLLFDKMSPAGIDVRGGGPASRETQLLNPVAAAEGINSILLSGGSAFGLNAAGGVMKFLSERNVGFDTGVRKVPLVCQSCLFDLAVGDKMAAPDEKMAYKACENAYLNNFSQGNFGAGTGCTVGKYHGISGAMKSGIGAYAVEIEGFKIGAVVAVNALGDVYNEDGQLIAGLINDKKEFLSTEKELFGDVLKNRETFNANTTIGAVITNGKFDKTKLVKIAAMAQNGLARAIRPVHTMADGDSVYAVSVGEEYADINAVGSLASYVMRKAIEQAVICADSRYGLPAYKEIKNINQ